MSNQAFRILVVDDESIIVQFMQSFIGADAQAYQVKTAVTGDDAVKQATQFRPHVVVLDIGIPGKDGYEVCETILSDPQCKHTIILGMTGKPEQEAHDRIMACGAADCLLKPFDFQAFSKQLREYAEESQRLEAGEKVANHY